MNPPRCDTVVIVCANIEWRAIRRIHPAVEFHQSPLGEWFLDGNIQFFEENTYRILQRLVAQLPEWIGCAQAAE